MEEFYFYTKGLTVGYHGVPLIKDIELCLKKGEIMTLIGPNGAGKNDDFKKHYPPVKTTGRRGLSGWILHGKADWQRTVTEAVGGADGAGAPGDDDLQGCSGNRPLSLYRKAWHSYKGR